MEDLIILGGSAVAVAFMVAVAAWGRIARQTAPLDADSTAALLAHEFPDRTPSFTWIAADGGGAIARDGETALVLFRLGDSWVSRALPWKDAVAAPVRGGQIRLRLRDTGAPSARLAVSGVNPWPPETQDEALAA